MPQNKVPSNRNYTALSESTKAVLVEFRDGVYETHGMIDPQLDILVNLFYHLMYEITIAVDEVDRGWGESDSFLKKHEQLAKLLDYHRPEPSDD